MFAVSILDGEGNDDRRAARICATINTTTLNVARRVPHVSIPDDLYRTEEDYLPTFAKRPQRRPRRQNWADMKTAIGF